MISVAVLLLVPILLDVKFVSLFVCSLPGATTSRAQIEMTELSAANFK